MDVSDHMNQSPYARDRVVLNANLDKTNVMNFMMFSEIAIDTLNNIINTIIPLCGPNAVHDLVIYEQSASNFVSNVFSHDGIHILRSIEHMSPIQAYISNYIQYVAERVNRAASDGTSTAIYLSASIILFTVKKLRSIYQENIDKINISDSNLTTQVNKAIANNIIAKDMSNNVISMLNDILLVIDQHKIDLNDTTLTREQKERLIRKLALTTSKGNKILADYAVDTFIDLPDVLYEQISYRRSDIETDKDFIIETPDYDAILSISPSGTAVYNTDLFTTIVHDKADLLIVPYYISSADVIASYIDNIDDDNDNHLVIVINGINDSALVALEKFINPNKVTLCKYTIYHPTFVNNPVELLALLALTGKTIRSVDTEDDLRSATIRDISIKIKSNNLYCYKLYKSDSVLHPLYGKDNTIYNKLQLEIAEKIRSYKTSHQQKDTSREVSEFVRIYKMLVCGKLPILTIGGSTTEHLANINIVDDVLGVVSVAMKHGVVLDIIPKISGCLKSSTKDKLDTIPYSELMIELSDTLDNFAKLTYHPNNPVWDYAVDTTDGLADIYYNQKFGYWCKDNTYTDSTVVQSYKSIKETISRILETIPKIISINDVIVPNSVINKGDKNVINK